VDRAERHRWARGVLLSAWQTVFGADPSLQELQTLQAQGALEGWYGFAATPPEWAGSNNWGAIDWTPGDAGTFDFFESTDHDVNGNEIHVRFRKYATPEDGAADLLREALVRRPDAAAALPSGLQAYAETLRANHYFVAPATQYAAGLLSNATEIANALGEPLSVSLEGGESTGTSLGAGAVLVGIALAMVAKLTGVFS
jgi:hypothetical protein